MQETTEEQKKRVGEAQLKMLQELCDLAGCELIEVKHPMFDAETMIPLPLTAVFNEDSLKARLDELKTETRGHLQYTEEETQRVIDALDKIEQDCEVDAPLNEH